MANKYTTLKNVEGYKTLDLNKYLIEQQDKLDDVKKQFGTPNNNGAYTDKTENAFFNAKEKEIQEQQQYIQRWIRSMGINWDSVGNLDIQLMVSEREQ